MWKGQTQILELHNILTNYRSSSGSGGSDRKNADRGDKKKGKQKVENDEIEEVDDSKGFPQKRRIGQLDTQGGDVQGNWQSGGGLMGQPRPRRPPRGGPSLLGLRKKSASTSSGSSSGVKKDEDEKKPKKDEDEKKPKKDEDEKKPIKDEDEKKPIKKE